MKRDKAMKLQSAIPSTDPAFVEAIAMYQRLRQYGQSGTLARISVEARFTQLTTAQRQHLHSVLALAETNR